MATEDNDAVTQLPIPREELKSTCCGPVKRCHAVKGLEWAFLAVSALTLSTSIGFTIERLATLPKSSDDFTFALVLLFTALMCVFYAVHGIFRERPYEILVFGFTTLIVLVYLIISVVGDPTKVIKQIRLGVASFLAVPNVILAILLLKRYFEEWRFIFRISASKNMQDMLRTYFFCRSLITFDLQLQGSMLISVLDSGFVTNLTENLILAFGVIITLAWLFCGLYGMKLEHKLLSWAFVVLSLPAIAYIGYRIVALQGTNPVGSLFYNAVITCAVLALIAQMLVIIFMALVIRNFGKGVKDSLEGRHPQKTAGVRTSFIVDPNPLQSNVTTSA